MTLSTGPRVFISYAREDRKTAFKVYRDLAKRSVQPWMDSENLLPGQDWQAEIRKAIANSDFFLALLSHHSVSKRGYIQRELRHALDVLDEFPEGHVYLIPVRLNECAPGYRRMEKIQWVDLFPFYARGIRRILDVLGVDAEEPRGDKTRITVVETAATHALLPLHDGHHLNNGRPGAETTGRESKLTLLGFGQISRALTAQLIAQKKTLRNYNGADLTVIGIADRSGIRIEEKGFSTQALQRLVKHKAGGGKLFDGDSLLTFQQMQTTMREQQRLMLSRRPIFVDLTAEETGPLLQEAFEHGFNVVTANKKPLVVPQIEFDRLVETAREHGLSFRYEATVGGGLPVLDTLAKLDEAGDRVDMILGCFSGVLGYIMTALEDGCWFADTVRNAWQLGYTERDPRDDLSGTDVALKALIMARSLGRRVNFEEIDVEPLYGPEVDSNDPATFVANLATLNSDFAARVALAKKSNRVLRYVAKIERRGIRVGIEAVPESSPIGHLRGTANQVTIYSKRYRTNPLTVTGPGDGVDVTAAGVLNDIVAITVEEQRRKSRR